jgi:hypothetical protein
VQNSNPHFESPQDQSPSYGIERPGISAEYLLASGIRRVAAQEADALVGCRHAGLVLPYSVPNSGGRSPVFDPDGKPYCRLRKDGIMTGCKYHQPANTRVHGYVPLDWATGDCGDAFIVVEGEFKSLALTDRRQGFAVPALGLSGFYGFHLAQEEGADLQLTPELKLALEGLKPKRIAFLGDADTSFNWQFANAAVRFKSLLPDAEIILPRIPIDQPKGVDDCRAKLGTGFERFFRRLVDDSVVLTGAEEPDELALHLLEPQLETAARLPAAEKAKLTERVAKMGACRGAGAREQLLSMVKKPLGIGVTELRKVINTKLAEVHKEDLEARMTGKLLVVLLA